MTLIDDGVCAVLAEVIQGEGGVNVADKDFLKGLRKLCYDNEILLIFDEVQTGIGRTGKLFAYQHYDIAPDVITLAKALANGVPIGAMIAKLDISNLLDAGTHASTFGGNPLACSVALTVLYTIEKENILTRVRLIGDYFYKNLMELKTKYNFVRRIKGIGLMLGMELEFEGSFIIEEMAKRGFLINCTAGNVLRFLPPLIVTSSDIDLLTSALDSVFSQIK
jgi:acetylornithine/N-succinyldiaminopimelate aminotransferase